MKKNDQKELAGSLLRVIPTKWAIAIVAILIGYVLLQPSLNRWFGWRLPSLASLSGDAKPEPEKKGDLPPKENQKTRDLPVQPEPKVGRASDKADEEPELGSETQSDREPASNQSPEKKAVSGKKDPAQNNEKNAGSSRAAPQTAEDYLKKVGERRFESPAGLVYGPGSEEGHRLKHIERHLEDIPNRAGPHGVFDGTMVEFLIAIDDAFTRAKKGEKGTSKRDDDGAMVYEASFPKAIGFMGGETGKRQKNPKLKKLRLVVRDNKNLITAFPVP